MICTRSGGVQFELWVGLNTRPTSFLITLFKSAEELREWRIKSSEALRECPPTGFHAAGGATGAALELEALFDARPQRKSHDELRECDEEWREEDDEVSGTRTMEPGRAAPDEVGRGSMGLLVEAVSTVACSASLGGMAGAARNP